MATNEKALANRSSSTITIPVGIDPERKDLIRKTICPPKTTDLEFEYFIAFAQRVELDPLLKQVWLVPRRQQDETGSYVSKMEPMVAEIGMRARADRLPDYQGTTGDYVCEGDEFMIDAGAGEVVHRYSIEARRKAGSKVIGAWARVERQGRRPSVVYVTFESRVQTFWDNKEKAHKQTPFWVRDPGGQIAKCARAAALRVAFPDVFSGMVIPEEMQDEAGAEERQPLDRTSASDSMEARLRQKLSVPRVEPKPLGTGASGSVVEPAKEAQSSDRAHPPAGSTSKPQAPMKVAEPPAAQETKEPAPVEPPKESPAASPPAAAKKKRAEIPITHLRFGAAAGTALADASGIELEEALQTGRAGLARAKGDEPWVGPAQEGITAIEAEIKRREAEDASIFGEAPEPGSAG